MIETPTGLLHRESDDIIELRTTDDFIIVWSFPVLTGNRAMTAGGGRVVVIDDAGALVAYG